MKTWPILLLSLSALLAVGCQPRGEYEKLHRELFEKENRIYALQSDIEQYRSVLDSCRRANLALEAAASGTADNERLPGGGSPLIPPAVELPGAGVPDVTLPEIELPGGSGLPEVELPPEVEEGDLEGPPPLFQGSSYQEAVPLEVEAGAYVETVTLNKLLTGGFNKDGHPGDEGLLVVIEPRDAAGQVVRATGDVSIVLLDAEAAGDDRRFARWDFSADEVKGHYRKSPLGEGLQFELPWPADPPVHTQMHIFARLTTVDGRKLAADKPIDVELLDGAIAAGLQRSVAEGILRLSTPPEVARATAESDSPPNDENQLRSVLIRPEPEPSAAVQLEPEPLRLPGEPEGRAAEPIPSSTTNDTKHTNKAEPVLDLELTDIREQAPPPSEVKPVEPPKRAIEIVEPAQERTPVREAARRPVWKPTR